MIPTQYIRPGWGTHPSNGGAFQNINHGRDQNNNQHGYQNINNWEGMAGGTVNQNSAGRDFVNNFYSTIANPNRNLWDIITGVGASHKAEQQVERGYCLPGTRQVALRMIHDWRSAKQQDHPIFWLSGAAGVGKSAIAMTVAEECEKEGGLVSTFFFFRSDPRRNNPSALWLTVAYGLASAMPALRNAIEERILTDPMIMEASLEHQFQQLILDPAPTFDWQGGLWGLFKDLAGVLPAPNLVIIDGLDECGDEETQIRILSIVRSALEQVPHFPLRFLISSRPEAWIQEAFATEGLGRLSKGIVLDEALESDRDIMRYYLHHFREIASNPKYSQLQFPNPWPSVRELEVLVRRTCGQFVYAATVIKFIKLAFRHPILQLRIILDNTAHRRHGTSPYHQLDALYDLILGANPDFNEVLPILAAILILPGYIEPSPAHIELILGLPMGQVTLTLRAMYSVLNIRGWSNDIRIYHASFRDYLVDPIRSRHFHVDLDAQTYSIRRQWLQNLATSKTQTYSSNFQLYGWETWDAFTKWVFFCIDCKPTRDLLNDLWNVDFSTAYLMTRMVEWKVAFERLVPWVRRYPRHDSSQWNTDKERDGLDFVESLVQKLLVRPKYFHLECPPGVSVRKEVIHYVVSQTTGTSLPIGGLSGAFPCGSDDVRLTVCHCDLSGGNESHNPGHLAYQEACLYHFRSLVFSFEIQSGTGVTPRHPWDIFMYIMKSPLLRFCRLDTELLSLCLAFFRLAKGCSPPMPGLSITAPNSVEEGKKNLFGWIDTIPDSFAEEREALRMEVLTFPWEKFLWP
ncbi:hypothetical protein PQX77_010562 [Marasmius sp. AFHP31]|nr:hypothetical protein PQX77_010562 [Marasmius sp. AFHP31]